MIVFFESNKLQSDNTCNSSTFNRLLHMHQPIFIALEGIDGSGKSTQCRLLTEYFNQKGMKVHTTCEPTDSPAGKLIRQIFKGEWQTDDRVIGGLFVADRLDHILNKKYGMLQYMEKGYHVISDRYYFSSYAYQGVHMPMEWVIQANSMSVDLLKPHVHIFIDVAPDESMKRINAGRDSKELYETLENLKRVRDAYFLAFDKQQSTENIVIIDGNKSPEDISLAIRNIVDSFL